MSVLIKGMDMPTSCYKCKMRQRDGMYIVCPVVQERFSVADVNILDYRLDNCPIIPVPPHGRLIDADALEDDDPDVCNSFMRDGYAESCEWGYSHAQIKNAPTVIPAEEGE